MAITISQVVTAMENKVDTLFSATGLDIVVDYAAAIGEALLEMGLPVSDITVPTDAELTAVTDSIRFIDTTEVRLLETAHNRLSLSVDTTIGLRRESLGQIAIALEKIIQRKRQSLVTRYGVRGAPLTLGHWDTVEENRAVARPFLLDDANDVAEAT